MNLKVADISINKSNRFPGMKMLGMRVREMNTTVFFSIMFVFLVALTFQGLDLLDEGFHVTFYQQIYNDPASVQYCFFYWLTGVVGGAWLKVFPALGLWGLRLAGALVTLGTMILAYRMLRKHIHTGVLKFSFILLALFINSEPKDIQYNNLSALFYFAAIALLMAGLSRKQGVLIALAGLLTGLNIFTRLPNLLGVGLGVVILYDAYLHVAHRKDIWKNIFSFAGGVLGGVAMIILVMKAMGHFDLFINSIKLLFSVGTSTSKNNGIEGSYGVTNLVYNLVKQYGISVSIVLLLIAFIMLWSFLLNVRTGAYTWFRRVIAILPFLGFLGIFWLIVKGKIDMEALIFLFTGISLFFTAIVLLRSKDSQLKLISLAGIFVVLVHPFGSAPGIMSVMLYSLWISFPVAISVIAGIRELKLNFWVSAQGSEEQQQFELTPLDWSRIRFTGVLVVVSLCLYQLVKHPYFYDDHQRTQMTHAVNNRNVRLIYTSGPRADAINELLSESSRYVRPNDFVLAYDAIPMYHFMTETRPFLNNPSPLFYATSNFEMELNKAVSERSLPVVVMQNHELVHDGSSWPEQIKQDPYLQSEKNIGKYEILTRFLQEHGYREAWSNEVFKILIPGNHP